MSTAQIAGAGQDLVAELEAQFGDRLTRARADYQENQSDRQKLDAKRGNLSAKKTKLEAKRKECLIAHGKGEKGAVAKRAEAEAELKSVNEEIEAVDEAIAYETERTGTLQTQLSEMETKLAEARKIQVQTRFAEALKAKKEDFITAYVMACTLLGEMVNAANDLIRAEGNALYDLVVEDLVLRTSPLILKDHHKYTDAQSVLGLARREFTVIALVPPPESD